MSLGVIGTGVAGSLFAGRPAVILTVWLVVFAGQGALGLVLGNYAASAVVLIGLWVSERHSLGMPSPAQLRPMLKFGLPTVPADADYASRSLAWG